MQIVKNRTHEQIYECIRFIESHGYKVTKREECKIGKWVAFTQYGMECILHGRVIRDYEGVYCVKCKNSHKRFVGLDRVIGFYETKEECYSIK